jgi:hypothetical protein
MFKNISSPRRIILIIRFGEPTSEARQLVGDKIMSKVGESIIQGAVEALEFAQGKDNGSLLHVPATSVPESSESDHKTKEKTED